MTTRNRDHIRLAINEALACAERAAVGPKSDREQDLIESVLGLCAVAAQLVDECEALEATCNARAKP